MKKAKIQKTLCILPILCLILCNCGSKKATQQKLGDVTGKVFTMGTSSPIPDILVSCSGVADTTDSSGVYSLLAIPIGIRSVTALKEGYQPWSASLDVRKGSNTLDIYMNLAVSTAREIVFYSQRSGGTQIYVMDSDGSRQEQITNLSFPIWYSERGPLWSPDKERIAFVTSLTRSSKEIMVINSDGTALDTLVHEASKFAQLGDWSPEGNEIVYQIRDVMTPLHYENFIINTGGTNNMKLDDGWQPRFCGNDKVVYAKGWNLYRINTDGTGKEQLTDSEIGGHKGCSFYMPVASPDGSKIAFGVVLPIDVVHYTLGIMNSDGSEDTVLVSGDSHGLKEIEFSPDGQKIMFLPNDADNSEIFVINFDGTNLDSLTGGIACADRGASWSTDGNWIVFTSNREGNKDIYKVSVDGKILVQLTDDVADDFRPDW